MRALSALAAALVAFALAACGGSDEPVAAEPPPATTATQPETTTETDTEPVETETEPAETETDTEPVETETATEPAETEPPATTENGPDVDVHVEVVEGERVGGKGRVEAKKGDRVRIEIAVDAAQEFHLHGYELSEEATPAKPAVFVFRAKLEGIFELESHLSEAVIVNLIVEP